MCVRELSIKESISPYYTCHFGKIINFDIFINPKFKAFLFIQKRECFLKSLMNHTVLVRND